jgi:hypothetical protein
MTLIEAAYTAVPVTGKRKTITLAYWTVPVHYEVKLVNNSVKYHPGQWLYEPEVAKLCDDPDWQVTTGSVDILSLLPIPLLKAKKGKTKGKRQSMRG